MNNLILNEPSIDGHILNFDSFTTKDYLPAQEDAIKLAQNKIGQFKQSQFTSLKHLIIEIEKIFDELSFVSNIFENQHHAHATEEINQIAKQFSDNNIVFYSSFFSDQDIYQKMISSKEKYYAEANKIEKRCFDKILHEFTDRGANKTPEIMNKVTQIDQEIAQAQIKFSENIRKEKSQKFLELNLQQVEDLPGRLVEYFKHLAQEKKSDAECVVGLDYPSVVGFLTHSSNRDLKQKLYTLNSTLVQSGKYSNIELAKNILMKRKERAKLLGYQDHPAFILEKRMLNDSEKVMSFLDDIFKRSLKKAQVEIEELKKFAQDELSINDLQNYDMLYVLNKYKEKNLQYDEEETRSYFPLGKVLAGLFSLVDKIFDIQLTEIEQVSKYHQEVRVFKVFNKQQFLGHLYFDFFPRDTKSSGAWMAELIECGNYKGQYIRPSISIVCNFSKPTGDKPALLSISEVETLFHEFGHALHGLCTQVEFKNISGTRVTWDYVELPSQIMENWIFEDEVLSLISEHVETKKSLPKDLVNKIKKSKNLFNGIGTLRQSKYGHLDMQFHLHEISSSTNLTELEREIIQKFELLELMDGVSYFPTFSHIFAGGYSSGYYSYHWASVLEADAFETFKENGILHKPTGLKFKQCILESGDSMPPEELYRNFKGRDANVEAFFRREEL